MSYTDSITVSKHSPQLIRTHSWNHLSFAGVAQVPLRAAHSPEDAQRAAKDFFNSTLKSSQCVLSSTVDYEDANSYRVTVKIMD